MIKTPPLFETMIWSTVISIETSLILSRGGAEELILFHASLIIIKIIKCCRQESGQSDWPRSPSRPMQSSPTGWSWCATMTWRGTSCTASNGENLRVILSSVSDIFLLQVPEWSRVLQIHPNWHPGYYCLSLPWHLCWCKPPNLLQVLGNIWGSELKYPYFQEYRSSETRIILRKVDLATTGMFR